MSATTLKIFSQNKKLLVLALRFSTLLLLSRPMLIARNISLQWQQVASTSIRSADAKAGYAGCTASARRIEVEVSGSDESSLLEERDPRAPCPAPPTPLPARRCAPRPARPTPRAPQRHSVAGAEKAAASAPGLRASARSPTPRMPRERAGQRRARRAFAVPLGRRRRESRSELAGPLRLSGRRRVGGDRAPPADGFSDIKGFPSNSLN